MVSYGCMCGSLDCPSCYPSSYNHCEQCGGRSKWEMVDNNPEQVGTCTCYDRCDSCGEYKIDCSCNRSEA